MGKVYKAYDTTLERNVAIKLLPPAVLTDSSRVSRFMQEARAASALNHPHVMAVYDIGEDRLDGSDVRYIAMELIDGKTVRELSAAGALDIRKAIKTVMQVAEALAAAHTAGIIHRDLKPENIMVTSGGYAKVLDFGLAKLRAREEQPSQDVSRTVAKETDPGTIMGTAGYMSPEQAAGKAVDHRSDIFSLGCVLYELATGRRAFRGDSTVDTLHKVMYSEPEAISSIRHDAPPELARILRKTLAKDPDDRYQTMKDLAIDLRELLRELDSSPSGAAAVPAAVGPAPAPGAGRRSTWIVAVLAVALVVAGIAFWPRKKTAVATATPMQITRVTASGKVIGGAISPDGKFLAYTFSDQGEQSLWVRQMGSGQTLQLIPPARVAYWGVSFSPDGNIYYGQKSTVDPSGSIYQISTLGGTPRKIIGAIDSQPAFSPDGKQMVFLRARFPSPSQSAVVIANADGTASRTLATCTEPELFVPIFFAGASWSPDGAIVASAVVDRDRRESWVVGIDVKSGAKRVIARGKWSQVAQVAWLPDGSGLVGIIQPALEPRSQVWLLPYPSGEPSQITKDLFDYRAVSVTADGKSLMTIASDINANLYTLPEGAEVKRITTGKLEGGDGLTTLADGRIVEVSLETGKSDLWVMNADGSSRSQITHDAFDNRSPAGTPDGKSVVYVSVTPTRTELCRINVDGSDRRVLATTHSNAYLDVSPDGKWVAFEVIKDNFPVLGRVSIDGGPVTTLTDYVATRPAFSPDGTQIANYSFWKESAIAITPATGGPPAMTRRFAPSFYGSHIVWTADGKSLIVNTAPSDRANLWLLPLGAGEPKKLTNFDEHILMEFAPLRDGRKGWVVSRGDLSRDAVLITGFR